MAREEFTIRITKKGEIVVETGDLPARRVKDLIKYLEETIGPARLVESDSGDEPGYEAIDREEAEEESQDEQDRLRLRDNDV